MACKQPVNRLLMLRQRGSGMLFQNVGNGVCAKSQGNFFAPGMPGSGVSAIRGVVIDANTIEVGFSACVNIASHLDCQYQINGGAWVTTSAVSEVSSTVWRFTCADTIAAGDDVRWRYVPGATITDCKDSENIGEQEVAVTNPLSMSGDFILLETGSSDILLLEEDNGIDPAEGYLTEAVA